MAQRGYFVRTDWGKYDARECVRAWYQEVDKFYFEVRRESVCTILDEAREEYLAEYGEN